MFECSVARAAPRAFDVEMAKPATLTFFYDFVSPYTYLASTQIEALATRTGTTVAWEPALLGGVMKLTGNQPPAMLEARAKYMMQDLARWATHYGVDFRFSPHFPLNSMAALRGAIAVRAQAPQAFAAYNTHCFRAAWVEGRDLGSKAVLEELAQACGLAKELVTAANDATEVKATLKANTERAVALGAFGFPYLVVEQPIEGGGVSSEGYFGNDRLPLLEARLQRGAPWPVAAGATPKM